MPLYIWIKPTVNKKIKEIMTKITNLLSNENNLYRLDKNTAHAIPKEKTAIVPIPISKTGSKKGKPKSIRTLKLFLLKAKSPSLLNDHVV